jgi:hypothetical protein
MGRPKTPACSGEKNREQARRSERGPEREGSGAATASEQRARARRAGANCRDKLQSNAPCTIGSGTGKVVICRMKPTRADERQSSYDSKARSEMSALLLRGQAADANLASFPVKMYVRQGGCGKSKYSKRLRRGIG